MSEEDRKRIAAMGGRAQSKESNPGNFANDIARARRSGKKGGSANSKSGQ